VGVVCRLWAEIFQLVENSNGNGRYGDDERSSWMRLSDGVAPINVTCSSSCDVDDASTATLTTVFRIAAYSRRVEKILDVTISQPGACVNVGVLSLTLLRIISTFGADCF